ALVCEGEELSYRELNRRANQFGRYLQGLGVGPETVLGLVMERSVALVVAVLGVLKAGAAYLPLETGTPRERLEWMLADAQVKVVVRQRGVGEEIGAAGKLKQVVWEEEWETISGEAEAEVESGVGAENLAYV